MRHILILAIVLLAVGGYAAQFADKVMTAGPATPATATRDVSAPREPVSSGRSLMLNANRQGHFEVEARIEGGPSISWSTPAPPWWPCAKAPPRRSASDRGRAEYMARVRTANGDVKAAPVKLDRIEIGGITVYDVSALVLPDEALSVNLLGVSFLSRLKRYEYADGRMVLEQ